MGISDELLLREIIGLICATAANKQNNDAQIYTRFLKPTFGISAQFICSLKWESCVHKNIVLFAEPLCASG